MADGMFVNRHHFEEEVVTDKSDETSTRSYYTQWSRKVVVFADRGDARANAAGPITDTNRPPETCAYYGQWSSKYEADMEASNYNGPKHVVESFVRLDLDVRSRILDVLAGSGLVAQLLRPYGYTNIDAVDGCQDMLHLAKEKRLYSNYYVSLLGGGHRAPIDDATYDVIITSGSFAPGHLYADVFGDLIRLAKPGGIITWSMRSDYGATSERFARFDDDVESLVEQNKWRHHRPRQNIDQYLLGSNGYVYVMQKL